MNRGSIDKTLIITVIVLVIIGLIAVYSSTSVLASVKAKYADRGGMIYLSETALYFTCRFFFYGYFYVFINRKAEKLVFPMLIISFIMLLLVFSPLGVSAGGARRWLRLWPSVFQPSELVKLAMVFFLAWYMSRSDYDRESFRQFIIPIGLLGIFQVIFLKQPDFGAAMTLGIITLSMLFIGGVSLRFLGIISLVAIPVIIYLAKEPYRWKRIVSFLDPWSDPQGSGFQLVQSLIALGSGGLIGQGLGEGKQKLAFLPEIHTDFIFAHIGEEMGFIGVSVVVILFFLICMRGLSIARKQSEPFYYFLASGITIMISIQALINFAVVTGLAPTKGLPLPFISYGGSSLVVNLIAVGILLNLSRLTHNPGFPEVVVQKKTKLRTYRYYYKSRGRA